MNRVDKKSILKISNHLYELKFIMKQLTADSKKCTREEESELAMVKIAIHRGNKESKLLLLPKKSINLLQVLREKCTALTLLCVS